MPDRLTRRRFLKLAGIGTAGTALGALSVVTLRDQLLTPFGWWQELKVDPYISQEEHLDSLPPPKLSFYKQPWRGYLETVPARQFLSGIGINYSLPEGSKHEPVLRLLAETGIRHARVEVGWSQVGWDETGLADQDMYATIFGAFKQHGIVPLVLLNAHHGIPGPNQYYERKVVSGGEQGSRSLVLDSVADLVAGRSGLSNLTDYKMCQVLITEIDSGARRVKLSRALPKALTNGTAVTIHTFKYLPLFPVGTAEFNETMSGWRRYVELALRPVVEAGISSFDVEIWNELAFGSDYLSINNYYENPIARSDKDFLQPGGQAWELGNQTVALVKRRFPGARLIWGFSNTDFYHTAIGDLPAGTGAQSYHPYGTNRQRIPGDFPPGESRPNFIEGFIPNLNWCMPEGTAHLATTQEQLIRGVLQPQVRSADKPQGVSAFAHCMTEHGFIAKEAGITEKDQAQAYKAKALIRALAFWLNKGMSFVDIYTVYDEPDALNGLLWSDPKPPAYRPGQPAGSPALTALKNMIKQFEGAEDLSQPRPLSVNVTALGGQTEVFRGGNRHPPLYYRDMFAFLPFQVHAHRFVVATYVMSYDITRPPPPMRFRLEIKGVDGPRATCRYYDPILDRELSRHAEEGHAVSSFTATLEQVEYPRLLVIDDG
jgi:hypothetical protein